MSRTPQAASSSPSTSGSPSAGTSTTGASASKAERTRERILDAAAATFRERGFTATRMADIADRAGLQAPSLYYYYPSKEELVEAVLALGVQRTWDEVRARVAEIPPDDHRARIGVAVRTHIEMVLRTENYSAANLSLYSQMPPEIRTRLLSLQREVGHYWQQLLEDADAAGALGSDLDLSATRMLILGALNWTVEWHRGGSLSVSEIADQAASMLLDGIVRDGALPPQT